MVEVDPATAQAVKKHYNMGRYSHEGGWIAEDERTVYLSDDNSNGSPIYKFVSDKDRDFTSGQLYAWKETQDGEAGEWLPLSMDWESMVNANDSAYVKGATVFVRLEWVQGVGNYVYITETGKGGNFDFSRAYGLGATLPKHLQERDAAMGEVDGKGEDLYGRVLRLNVNTGKVDVLLEGGGEASGDDISGNHLMSPDGLVHADINGRSFLAINEDANASGLPFSPAQFDNVLNEIYWLDITDDASGKTYSVSDLNRFAAGPKGCETTGGRFTPDGETYFVNIQHPSSDNTPPFNHSTTIAVTGYAEAMKTGSVQGLNDFNESDVFSAYPNPVSRELKLNKTTDCALYNASGSRVAVYENTNTVNVSAINAGVYFLKTADNEVVKIVVE